MAINFTGVARAPSYDWEVFMKRCIGMNAYENSRARIAYVQAPNEKDAMRAAKKKHPEFHPVSCKRTK